MPRVPTILTALVALLLFAYLALRMGLLAGFYAPDNAPSPAQSAPQTHAENFWKNFKKPADAALRATLTPLEYDVTQKDGTETPFDNAYYNNEQEGVYVDIVSGEPLFSSKDKFDSGTGWPSFTKPLDPSVVTLHTDGTLGMQRTEVRSKLADSHLGHLFDDGPAPLGLRYCMNSASLRFIPQDRLVAEGYGAYTSLFK